jgi:mannose-6-phosphate isomerase
MADKPPFLVLSPAVQTYAWGKKGYQSEACRLKACGDSDFEVDESQTYAELWMGTHKNGPSAIKHPKHLAGTLLSDWLKSNQWALGDRVAKQFGGELPFLLKILSVNRALSIQAHPDKERAAQLHKTAPDKYPDPNHKPEMVIALREFEGMCGFRPFPAVQSWVMSVPELQNVLGQQVADTIIGLPNDAPPRDQLMVMKLGFSSLMSADSALVKQQLVALEERLGGRQEPWTVCMCPRAVSCLY